MQCGRRTEEKTWNQNEKKARKIEEKRKYRYVFYIVYVIRKELVGIELMLLYGDAIPRSLSYGV